MIKIDFEYEDLINFAEALDNYEQYESYMMMAAQELAKALHRMLLLRTPVVTGQLRSGWNKGDNLAFNIRRENGGFYVTLTNYTEYAKSVNDGHYSYNQFNKGGDPYVVRNRTPKIYDIEGSNKSDTYVFGHFFVEKALIDVETVDLERIIYDKLDDWFGWCCG